MKHKSAIIYGTYNAVYKAYQKLKIIYNQIYIIKDFQAQISNEIFCKNMLNIDELSQEIISTSDTFVCQEDEFEINKLLDKKKIIDYYVFIDGFIWHSDKNETMMPIELNDYEIYTKSKCEKNILIVSNYETKRINEFAKRFIKEGFKVFFLSSLVFRESTELYENNFIFSSPNAIVDFINKSEFDDVWCFDTHDVLTCLAMCSTKEVKLDKRAIGAIDGRAGINSLALDFISREYCKKEDEDAKSCNGSWSATSVC